MVNIKLIRLLCLVCLIAMPTSGYADSMKTLVIEALKTGKAEGYLTDGVAQVIGTAVKTKGPVPVTIKKIYSFPSGCGRLHMEFKIIDGKDQNDKLMPPQILWFEANLCANGQGPSREEFIEWQEYEKKREDKVGDKHK